MNSIILSQLSIATINVLKTLGALAIAAVLLYIVLVLVRVVGNKLEIKSYQRYVDKCTKEGTAPLPYTDFVERRAKGEKILWQRTAPNEIVADNTRETAAQQTEDNQQATNSEATPSCSTNKDEHDE